MSNVKNIVSLMEELREDIIKEKSSLREMINELTAKIENSMAIGNYERANLYQKVKVELLNDYSYLKSIDRNNELTYNVLGYHITGYHKRQERLRAV